MRHKSSLDGLRAVAVTSVVVFHAHKALWPGGWVGVDVFFVLSGYLISTILLNEAANTGRLDFKRFYIRRALRLFPALACMLLVLTAFSVAGGPHRLQHFEDILMSAAYVMNWNRAFDWVPGEGGALAHTWSLSMEEQFYFIWPISLLLLLKARRLAPWIISGLVVLVFSWRFYLVYSGAGSGRIYNGFDTHCDTLLIGCAVAFFDIGSAAKRFASRFVVVPILGVVVFFSMFQFETRLAQVAGITLAGLCAAWMMIAALEERGLFGRLLCLRPLVYTGRISYGWYLWHYPFLFIGARLLHRNDAWPLLVVASYLTAMASYRFVELPFLRLKDRFEPRNAVDKSRLVAAG